MDARERHRRTSTDAVTQSDADGRLAGRRTTVAESDRRAHRAGSSRSQTTGWLGSERAGPTIIGALIVMLCLPKPSAILAAFSTPSSVTDDSSVIGAVNVPDVPNDNSTSAMSESSAIRHEVDTGP